MLIFVRISGLLMGLYSVFASMTAMQLLDLPFVSYFKLGSRGGIHIFLCPRVTASFSHWPFDASSALQVLQLSFPNHVP